MNALPKGPSKAEQIVALDGQGLTNAEIAARVHCSDAWVSIVLRGGKTLGQVMPPKAPPRPYRRHATEALREWLAERQRLIAFHREQIDSHRLYAEEISRELRLREQTRRQDERPGERPREPTAGDE